MDIVTNPIVVGVFAGSLSYAYLVYSKDQQKDKYNNDLIRFKCIHS